MVSKLRKVDKKLTINKKYTISAKHGRHGGKKRGPDFRATLFKKMDLFYVFITEKEYKECILKVDFAIGDYQIKDLIA